MEDFRLRVGRNIETLRKRTGLSQAKFAKDCDIRQATLSLWENGKAWPEYDRLVKAAEICGVEIMAFFEHEPSVIKPSITEALEVIAELAGQKIEPKTADTTHLLDRIAELEVEVERLRKEKDDPPDTLYQSGIHESPSPELAEILSDDMTVGDLVALLPGLHQDQRDTLASMANTFTSMNAEEGEDIDRKLSG